MYDQCYLFHGNALFRSQVCIFYIACLPSLVSHGEIKDSNKDKLSTQ